MYDYNSSNARKFNYSDYNVKRPQVLNAPSKRTVKKVKKESAFSLTIKRMFVVAFSFIVAFSVVRGYVMMNEANNNISKLKEDLRMVQSENQAIRAQIDKNIDLKNLQAIAGEKFKMVRPDSYQIYYVDLKFDDYSENVKEKEEKEKENSVPVEGVTGVLISSADMFR